MIFVYGTRGTAEENRWAFAKARFDAESWYYRGNGAVDILPDAMFSASSEPERGVVLYGNADNNAAWNALLGEGPVQVRRDLIQIGRRQIKGDDLACIFCWPRLGTERAMVAAVSGSGITGLRLTDRLPYFVSGVAFPDCTVFGAETLRTGAAGLRVCGFFGTDWTVEGREFAWKD